MEAVRIEECGAEALPALRPLYSSAFPGEDLLPLVGQLLGGCPGVWSFAAVCGHDLIGHILFSRCGIGEVMGPVALLGPLAIDPRHQRRGIGGALIRHGVDILGRGGVSRILVLGDPGYYSRFGFQPESELLPPYDLPQEWAAAWQSRPLGGTAGHGAGPGRLTVPEPWRRSSLWSP